MSMPSSLMSWYRSSFLPQTLPAFQYASHKAFPLFALQGRAVIFSYEEDNSS
jgi:hypothetical protein